MRKTAGSILTILGLYGCTFHQKAIITYKNLTNCEGYFIRKYKWVRLLGGIDDYIRDTIKLKILVDYNKLVHL